MAHMGQRSTFPVLYISDGRGLKNASVSKQILQTHICEVYVFVHVPV